MASKQPPDHGTLVIAALLILALAFSGVWINSYVQGNDVPWNLVTYFLAAAGGIVLLGILLYFRPGGRDET